MELYLLVGEAVGLVDYWTGLSWFGRSPDFQHLSLRLRDMGFLEEGVVSLCALFSESDSFEPVGFTPWVLVEPAFSVSGVSFTPAVSVTGA